MNDRLPTLRQLRYLVALDETGNFRRAAEQCDISQPSLSVQIQNIEEVLGVHLVERSRSGVTLTPVGRDIVRRARRVLDEVQGIVDFAAGAQRGLVGTIRLGAKPTLGPYLLPHVVAKLHRQHPELNLYVREGAPRELEYDLGRGIHDVILAHLPVAGTELVTRRLFREPLYLALAADHPLARQKDVAAESLQGLEVLSLRPDFRLHQQISEICRDFGAIVARDYEGTSLDALRQMVGMGMGVTFLPALYVRSEIPSRGEVVVKKLRGKTITRPIGLVWRKSAGRARAYEEIANVICDVAITRFRGVIVDG
jgi:LysR family transcriptional regulator, hydrogen peroxide-inducible genes activator